MLQEAIEVEVADYVDQHQGERAPGSGQRLVVRNGRLPAREILSSLGSIPIEQPRVRDRREGRSSPARSCRRICVGRPRWRR